jgi:hypothetical protein
MQELSQVAPAFVAMAHEIVWCSAATVDKRGRPRARILHPIWEWDGERLVGWVGTGPTPTKRAHLAAHPYLSANYWAPSQDTCTADCHAAWAFDDATRTRVWALYSSAPPPLGYDPSIIPAWTSPTAEAFAVLRLEPWHLRVFPGGVLFGQGGEVLDWRA